MEYSQQQKERRGRGRGGRVDGGLSAEEHRAQVEQGLRASRVSPPWALSPHRLCGPSQVLPPPHLRFSLFKEGGNNTHSIGLLENGGRKTPTNYLAQVRAS